MKYDFDEFIDREGTHSVKTDLLPEGAPWGTLPLWVADMDFPCASPILDALHRRVDKKIFGYTHYDNDKVKDAVYSWFHRRYDWDIENPWIFHSPGVVPALALLVNALTKEGDGIIIQKPVYYPFTDKISNNDRLVSNSPLRQKDNTYVMDFDDLELKFADPVNKGMILCSPHNPVGRVWTNAELLKLVEIAKKYDKWIISDEIHCDLTRKNVLFTPLLKAAPEYKDRIIICTAPTKTFNLAGMHISSIIIPNPGYREKWKELAGARLSAAGGINPFSMEAMIAAYNEGDEWLDQAREYIDGNIEYIEEFAESRLPKARVTKCEGTYLVWINLGAYISDHKKLEHVLIHEARLALSSGYAFGGEGEGFERINAASPRSKIMDCMERLERALADYA